jgi:lysophospholipase L1-like esterase
MRKIGASRSWFRIEFAVSVALLALCSGLACSSSSSDGSGAAGGRGGRAGGGSAGAAGVAGVGGTTAGSSGTAGAGGSTPSGGSSSGGTSGAGMGGSSAGRGGTGGFSGSAGSGAGGLDGSAGSTAGVGGTAGSAAGSGGSAGSAGGSAGSGGDPDGGAYNPCPTDGNPCKILPLGDSITEGIGSSHGGAYRVDLFQRALDANRRLTFVGSKRSGPTMVGGTTFPRNHEGYSGETIDQIAGRVPAVLSQTPDIILLMIGTNDMYRTGAADAPRRLEALIDKILAADSRALLVVAQIVPFPGNMNVAPYNAAIPAIIQRKVAAGKHIVLVDQHSGFPASDLNMDGVHPNDSGYRRMAGVWYSAVGPLLR